MDYRKKLLEIRTDLLLDELGELKISKPSRRMISEKLERSDKKEIDKMIQRALSANEKEVKAQRKKDDIQRKKEFSNFLKSKEFKNAMKDSIETELQRHTSSILSKEEVVDITKKVLVKLYRELAYNYTPVIDRIKL
jgi:hypothetical protein